MEYRDFLEKIREIRSRGFIETHRNGDTGIGKTLEDLLGITENNISGPDFSIYELKAARKDSVSMLTLFTKAPQPTSANSRLLDAFGYPRRKPSATRTRASNPRGSSVASKELHVTVDSVRVNSVGLKLEVRESRVYIANPKTIEAYYDAQLLKGAFEKKYHALIYVLASNRKDRGSEWFWYTDAYVLDGFSFERFSDLILKGKLKLDLRLGHYADGLPHDHGTAFRIDRKDLPLCFAKTQQIL